MAKQSAKTVYRRFWTEFEKRLAGHSVFRSTGMSERYYSNYSVGWNQAHLAAIAQVRKPELRVELVVHSQDRYRSISERLAHFQTLVSLPLHSYDEAEEQCRLYVSRDGKLDDERSWPEFQDWLKTWLERFYEVFDRELRSRIR